MRFDKNRARAEYISRAMAPYNGAIDDLAKQLWNGARDLSAQICKDGPGEEEAATVMSSIFATVAARVDAVMSRHASHAAFYAQRDDGELEELDASPYSWHPK